MQLRNKQLWQGDGATLQPVSYVKQQPGAFEPPIYYLHATIYFH